LISCPSENAQQETGLGLFAPFALKEGGPDLKGLAGLIKGEGSLPRGLEGQMEWEIQHVNHSEYRPLPRDCPWIAQGFNS
jgi:hypothetical protein